MVHTPLLAAAVMGDWVKQGCLCTTTHQMRVMRVLTDETETFGSEKVANTGHKVQIPLARARGRIPMDGSSRRKNQEYLARLA